MTAAVVRGSGVCAGTDAGRDGGNALVEFVWLAVLLMVPLVYLVLAAVSVQRSAFGITEATREASRAYATAGSDQVGQERAVLAARLAMTDQGVDWQATGPVVSCGGCDYAPGSTYTVSLHTRIALPLIPGWLCGHACVAGINVSADHTGRLSCYSGTGPVDPGAAC